MFFFQRERLEEYSLEHARFEAQEAAGLPMSSDEAETQVSVAASISIFICVALSVLMGIGFNVILQVLS